MFPNPNICNLLVPSMCDLTLIFFLDEQPVRGSHSNSSQRNHSISDGVKQGALDAFEQSI